MFETQEQPDGSYTIPGTPLPYERLHPQSPEQVAAEAAADFKGYYDDFNHRVEAFSQRLEERGIHDYQTVDTFLGKQISAAIEKVGGLVDEYNSFTHAFDADKAEKFPHLVTSIADAIKQFTTLTEKMETLLGVVEHEPVAETELNRENIRNIDAKRAWLSERWRDVEQFEAYKKTSFGGNNLEAVFPDLYRELVGKTETYTRSITSAAGMFADPALPTELLLGRVLEVQKQRATILGIIEEFERVRSQGFVPGQKAEPVAEIDPLAANAPITPKPFALKTGEAGVLLGEARRLLDDLSGKRALNLEHAHLFRNQAKEAWRNAKPVFDQAEAAYQREFAAREAIRAAKTFGKDKVDDTALRAAAAKRDEARAVYQRALSASNTFREQELAFRQQTLPGELAAARATRDTAVAAVTERLRTANPELSIEALSQALGKDATYRAAIEKLAQLESATKEVEHRDRLRAGYEKAVIRARAQKADGTLEGTKKLETVTFEPLAGRMQAAVRRGLIDRSLEAEQKATRDAIKANPGVLSRAQAMMIEKVTSALKTPEGKWNKKRVALVGALAVGGLSGLVITTPALLASVPVGFLTRYGTKWGVNRLGRAVSLDRKEAALQAEKAQATRDIFSGDVSSMARSQRDLQTSIDTATKRWRRGSEGLGAIAGIVAGAGTTYGLQNAFPETFAGRVANAAVQPEPPVSPYATPSQPEPPPPAPPSEVRVNVTLPTEDQVALRELNRRIDELGSGLRTEAPPPPAVAPEATPGREVVVLRGNVLSRLLHEQMVDAQAQAQGGQPVPAAERQRLARLMYERFPEMRGAEGIRATTPVERWALSPEQWREVGVASGDPNFIRPGEKINMQRLLEVISPRPIAEAAPGPVLTPPPPPPPPPPPVPEIPPPPPNPVRVPPVPPSDPVTGRLNIVSSDRTGETPVLVSTDAVVRDRVVEVGRADFDDSGFAAFVERVFGSREEFVRQQGALLSEINPQQGFLDGLLSVRVNNELPFNEAQPNLTLEAFLADLRTPAEVAASLRAGSPPINVNPDSIARWREAIPQLVDLLQEGGSVVDRQETTISELINAATANRISL